MTVRELRSPPSLTLLYAKAAVTAARRGGELPDTELVLDDVAVDRDHLAAYDRVCGFTLSDRLPATYLHVLAFPLSVALMADPDFPLPLPGLVHVGNRITHHRTGHAGERFRLTARAQDLRPHRKGRQVDLVAEAAVGGEPVWRDVSTYLRRDGGGDARSEQRSAGDSDRAAPSAVWRVAGDTGRRYAAVSGDRNPIHLTALTARLFGFSRPIAHGMWAKARSLAALGRLPDRFTVDVAFKAPLLLPSTVEFASRAEADGWTFALRARSGKPHLAGEVVAV